MQDYIIRATAADAYIRAFAATTRDLVEEARSLHNTSPVATAALGRTLTAGIENLSKMYELLRREFLFVLLLLSCNSIT